MNGELFVPAEESTTNCMAVDLSAGGAGVQCEEVPPLNTYVVLYIDGFGRYEAVSTRFADGVLGLRFVFRDEKRDRLLEKLNLFVNEGHVDDTRRRAHERVPHMAAAYFTRPSGERVKCRIIDASLEGISLRTKSRPPLGEIIRISRTYGCVVRHHDQGIGVQFKFADEVGLNVESKKAGGRRGN